MNFDPQFWIECSSAVLRAVPVTLLLTFAPMVLALVPALFIAWILDCKIPVASQLFRIYNSLFRSVPLIVLLFLAYYGTPKILNFVIYGGQRVLSFSDMNCYLVALVAITLYAIAFQSEIMRGAIRGVDAGQMEAAKSLGLGGMQAFLSVILPQAIRVAIPNLTNFCLALLKGTSVVFAISVIDMMAAAKLQAEIGYRYLEAYLIVCVFYVILSFVIAGVLRRVRKVYEI